MNYRSKALIQEWIDKFPLDLLVEETDIRGGQFQELFRIDTAQKQRRVLVTIDAACWSTLGTCHRLNGTVTYDQPNETPSCPQPSKSPLSPNPNDTLGKS